MTLPPLATVEELEQRLGRDIPHGEATAQASWLLGYSSALVRAYCRADWIDPDTGLLGPLPSGVAEVAVEIVYRAVTNPEGVTQDSAGSFSVSFGSEAAQRMFLTAGDKAILGGTGRSSIGTLSTTRGPIETPTVHGDTGIADLDFPFLGDRLP